MTPAAPAQHHQFSRCGCGLPARYVARRCRSQRHVATAVSSSARPTWTVHKLAGPDDVSRGRTRTLAGPIPPRQRRPPPRIARATASRAVPARAMRVETRKRSVSPHLIARSPHPIPVRRPGSDSGSGSALQVRDQSVADLLRDRARVRLVRPAADSGDDGDGQLIGDAHPELARPV